jgi:hypothetical protein
MKSALRRSIVTAAVQGLMGAPARADLALEYTSGSSYANLGDAAFGWSFTTTQAITVDALGALDGGSGNSVRLYDSTGTTLAQAVVSNSDPTEGVPIPFHFVSISPVTLQAKQTYFFVEDFISLVTGFNAGVSGLMTDPAIVYGDSVEGNYGTNPTTDAVPFFDPGVFGPNFEICTASAVPEPSTVAPCLTALVGGLCYAWRRRRATTRGFASS